MSEAVEQWIDGAIGETRHALARGGKPYALVLTRWSDEGRRARWGETYIGRVRAVERGLRGAFVDLGLKDEQGFLPLRESQSVREGETLTVRVEREGARGKRPNLSLLARPGEGQALASTLGRIGRHDSDANRDGAGPASAAVRENLDALIDEATRREVPLAGGGKLIIEPTAALTAIDVDAAGRKGGDPERLALALNLEAAREALRQLRLRNLGGQAVIDFVTMKRAENRKAVEDELKRWRLRDPWGPVFAPLSRFGIVELARAQYQRPLHEILFDAAGRKSAETLALETLRAIERETASARGRKIVARVSPEVADWLDSGVIAWRAALEARIGALWAIERAPDRAREAIDVRAV